MESSGERPEGKPSNDEVCHSGPAGQRRPLQFGLRGAMLATLALGLVFATLRWFDVDTRSSLIVLGVLTVSLLAGLALVLVIAATPDDED